MRTNGKKATPLCPCGYLGHFNGKCHCTPDQIARYRGKISGPLLDRIDIQIEVPAVPHEDLIHNKTQGEKSSSIQARVEKAHQHQHSRQGKTNNDLTVKEIEQLSTPNDAGEKLLQNAMNRLNFSARAYHRILKVARTIADLAECKEITSPHIAEAIQYRRLYKN